jgi:hypothetical protein
VSVQQPSRPDESLGELVSTLTNDLGALIRDEVRLARVEISEDLTKVARAGGMLGGAAIAGYTAVLVLSLAACWGLAEVMPIGFAFAIVGVIWVLVAAVLFAVGRNRMQAANVKPEQTIETMQENLEWAKQQKS